VREIGQLNMFGQYLLPPDTRQQYHPNALRVGCLANDLVVCHN
jgi:hypothetical protein